MKSPCKGCDRRKVGCHANCPEYQAYTAECVKKRAERHEKSEYAHYIVTVNKRITKHSKKRWGQL